MNIILGLVRAGQEKIPCYAMPEWRWLAMKNSDLPDVISPGPPNGSEDNYYLDGRAFKVLEGCGFFLSTWQAHNNYYGIGAHILAENNGLETVVCSVSRSAIDDFESRCDQTSTIEVTAGEEVLKARLRSRGRETEADIDRRLARAKRDVVAKHRIVFDNSSPLEESCIRFTSLLLKVGAKRESLLQ